LCESCSCVCGAPVMDVLGRRRYLCVACAEVALKPVYIGADPRLARENTHPPREIAKSVRTIFLYERSFLTQNINHSSLT